MPNLNIKATNENTYDAIVIGSGISGGWAAKELCEKRLKTLVLERGRIVTHIEDYPTMNFEHWNFEANLRDGIAIDRPIRYKDDDCQKTYSRPFLDLNNEEKETFLKKIDAAAAFFPPSIWGISLSEPVPTDFFRQLKDLTLFGYYTSQKIGQEVLSYEAIPGPFVGCIPVSEVGNAWNE